MVGRGWPPRRSPRDMADPAGSDRVDGPKVDGPMRTCIGCRVVRSQRELIRLHLDEAGALNADRAGSGRGAWLCAVSATVCLAAAIDRNALARAFKRQPERESVRVFADRLAPSAPEIRPSPGSETDSDTTQVY